MRATVTSLTALVVSALTLNAASAQMPLYPVQPAAYSGYEAYPGSSGPVPNGGPVANAAPVVGTTTGGCSSCGKSGCGAGSGSGLLHNLGLLGNLGCAGCEKPHFFHKSSKGCDSCGGKGNALCAAFKGWLCKPCPSDAPMCVKPGYPLGFPTHPYARSPRDYFMYYDP